MEGLLAEGSECLESREPSPLRDLAIIGAAQRVELYEVAAYGTDPAAIAAECGLQACVELLSETLEEEEVADQTLTEVAETIYGFSEPQSEEEAEEVNPAIL